MDSIRKLCAERNTEDWSIEYAVNDSYDFVKGGE